MTSDLKRFHQEMGALDGPMIIVTAVGADGQRAGCLVGFHTQASIDPPRYLVCLSNKNHTFQVARAATHLAVHFLGADQRDLAERFGTTCSAETDKFEGVDVMDGPEGTAVVGGVAHWFVGRILGQLPTNDHVVFALEPVASDGTERPLALLGFQAVKDLEAGHAP